MLWEKNSPFSSSVRQPSSQDNKTSFLSNEMHDSGKASSTHPGLKCSCIPMQSQRRREKLLFYSLSFVKHWEADIVGPWGRKKWLCFKAEVWNKSYQILSCFPGPHSPSLTIVRKVYFTYLTHSIFPKNEGQISKTLQEIRNCFRVLGSEEKLKGSPLLLERLWIEGNTRFIPLIKHWREGSPQTRRIKVGKWARVSNHPVVCQKCPHHVLVSLHAPPGHAGNTNLGRGCAEGWQGWSCTYGLSPEPHSNFGDRTQTHNRHPPPSILWSCRNDRNPRFSPLFTNLCGSLPPSTAGSPVHPSPEQGNCGETKDCSEPWEQKLIKI